MKRTLSIVGAGRVGKTLGRRLRERGWRIAAVVTRSQATARAAARAIGAGTPLVLGGNVSRQVLETIFSAGLIFITPADDVLPSLVATLAGLAGEKVRGKIILHTAASLDRTALAPLARHGASVGSLHPMQAFGGAIMPSLENVIFAVEGDAKARRVATSIARSLGGLPVIIDTRDKPVYHASAVIAAGSAYPTIEAGLQLLVSIGFTRQRAQQTLFPLLRQILDNIERIGPRAAWTGPLSRGDYAIVARHTKALRKYPREFRDAYAALAMLAGRTLAENPAAARKKIAQSLGDSR